jgi:hypothetical protein
MPVHDWTKVPAGIFHDFHHTWITELKRLLNGGLLPEGYYALAEQITGGFGPDVLTLQHEHADESSRLNPGGIAAQTATASPPQTRFHFRAETDRYAEKANVISLRHVSGDEIIAMIEIVSPGNKSGRRALGDFIEKGEQLLRGGVHLLVVDLFPPSSGDPDGIPVLLWDQFGGEERDKARGIGRAAGAFVAGFVVEAFIEPISIGRELATMPLFISPEKYVPVALEQTYRSAWETVPSLWRERLA